MTTLPATILGKGAPVVLLHAFPLDGRMWLPQAQALSDGFQVIVPDQRGFGLAPSSAGNPDVITIDQAADDIAQLLTAHHIDEAVLGGISRGGYVALAFARRHPERLKALMLFDTRATPADDVETRAFAAIAARLESEGIGFLPEMMKPRLFGATTLRKRQHLVRQVTEMILEQNPKRVAAAALGMPRRLDARPILAELNIPVLAIAGAEDGAFKDTQAIAAAVPSAQFVEIPEAGHLSNLEQPDLVTETMRAFLRSLPGGSQPTVQQP